MRFKTWAWGLSVASMALLTACGGGGGDGGNADVRLLNASKDDVGAANLKEDNYIRVRVRVFKRGVTELRAIVEPLGRPLEQRTTLYGRTQTVGRRLRPVDDDGLGGTVDHLVELASRAPSARFVTRSASPPASAASRCAQSGCASS